MADPTAVVTEFLAAASQGRAGFARAVRDWFTPQTVWENVGMGTTTGPDAAIGVMEAMAARGLDSLRVENLAVAAQGNTVLTERIDYMLDAGGKPVMEVRVMGAFTVDAAGKISRWTDYFDTAPFLRPAG